MVSPTNLSAARGNRHEWEVLKNNKIYPIESHDLLVSLWESERLKPHDSIRRHGEQEWRSADSVNWPVLIASLANQSTQPTLGHQATLSLQATVPLPSPGQHVRSTESTTDEVSSEGVETAEVAVNEAELLEEAQAAAAAAALQAQAQARPAWWHDETPAKAGSTNLNRQLNRVIVLITAAIVLLVIVIVVGLSNWRKPTDQLSQSITDSTTESITNSATDSITVSASTASQSSAESPNIDAAEAVDMPSIAPESTASIASVPGSMIAADSRTAQGGAAESSVADSPLPHPMPIAQPEEKSQSAELGQPAQSSQSDIEIKRLVAQVMDSIQLYRGTRGEIGEFRKTMADATNTIQLAEQTAGALAARIPQLNSTIQMINLELPRLNLQAGVSVRADRAAGVDAEAELNAAIKLKQQALTELQSISINQANCQQTVQAQTLRIKQAVQALQEIVRKEHGSFEKYMELIDFFGEKPHEFHRQVFEQTSSIVFEEPDLYMAYLLNSAAALNLERYDVPEKNLRMMQSQFASINDQERAHRQLALVRFQAIGKALTAAAQWRQSREDTSLKLVDEALKAEPKQAELHLLRGVIAAQVRGMKDGNSSFRAAANLSPNDARVRRIHLDTLLKTTSPSPQLLRSLLNELLKVVVSDDQRSRMTAAETRFALQEYTQAAVYLEKVDAPELQDRKAKLEQALKNMAAQSPPSP